MRLRIACLLIVSAAEMLGCGASQAGSDYQGEPLMTLRGVVQSPAALSGSDLVPGLRFESLYDNMDAARGCSDTATCAFMTYYTKGEVEGRFPSSFTLRVFDAPPADVRQRLAFRSLGRRRARRACRPAFARAHCALLALSRTSGLVDRLAKPIRVLAARDTRLARRLSPAADPAGRTVSFDRARVAARRGRRAPGARRTAAIPQRPAHER